MPGNPDLSCRSLRRALAAALLAACSGVTLADPTPTPVLATSSASNDAVDRWLVDQGLAAAALPASAALPAPTTAERSRSMHERVSEMLVSAMGLLGAPYRRGGNSVATGFDCSGFTRYVFDSGLGLLLPRRADEQATAARLVPVARSDLQPGDLVFFNTLRRTFSHVGIYLGENRFIHAPSTGKDVRIEDISMAYWTKRFTGARRLEGPDRGE